MKFFRKLPIEFFIIFFPFFIVVTFFLLAIFFGYLSSDLTFFTLDSEAIFGGRYFRLFLNIVYFYVILRINISVFVLLKKYKNEECTLADVFKKLLSNILVLTFWSLFFYFSTIVYGRMVGYIYRHVSPHSVEYFTNMFMNADYSIFGVYPPFWLQHIISYEPLGFLSVLAYKKLTLFISVVLISALFFNTHLLRKFVIAFIVAGFIAIPFWALLPAISPQSMYLENIMQSHLSEDILQEVKTVTIEKNVADYLPIGHKNWVDPKGESFAVSTFPSMHMAWGTIVLLVGISLYAPLAVVLVPWYFFNTLGTMVTFEHYAVDVVTGLLLALLALYIAERALRYEKKYYLDSYGLVDFWKLFEVDGKRFLAYCKTKLPR